MCTIGGGQFNNISNGVFAGTIPGGYVNVVEQNHGFAAGTYAKSAHVGAIVISDSSAHSAFASTNSNEFAVRAHGGLRFQTGSSAGVVAYPGGSGWSVISDRAAKENFKEVDGKVVLEQVAGLPLTTWNYKAQGTDVRHMAQWHRISKRLLG